jgi:hypothetical protein
MAQERDSAASQLEDYASSKQVASIVEVFKHTIRVDFFVLFKTSDRLTTSFGAPIGNKLGSFEAHKDQRLLNASYFLF